MGRVNVTREIHRNYIGIRVLIHVSRVNDVHEAFHFEKNKVEYKFQRRKKTSAEFYNVSDTKFYYV